jgi:hypothetical protein
MSIRRTIHTVTLLCLVVVAAACSGDASAPEVPKATSLQVVGSATQSGAVGAAVSTVPAVRALSASGAPVPGVVVTFAVSAGGGSLGATTATTGTDGTASATSWVLGTTAGTNTVSATAAGLSPVTFTATATVPTGCTITNYALGATLPLNWETNDCKKLDGKRYDQLQFTTTTQQIIDAAVTAPSGRFLQLRNQDSLFVGLQPGTAFSPPTQNPMHMKYVLAPGTYTFEPIAPDSSATGAYSFSTSTNAAINCDYIIFATPNVTFSGAVDNTSCLGPFNDREQWINLQLKTGMKVRITLSGTDDVPFLIFRDDRLGPASPTLVTARGTTKGETVSVTWTAAFDTWHEIVITSATVNSLGKYTLKIEQLP